MLQRLKYSLILTDRELEVINRKLSHRSLTQQDSNYLCKYVRPKLKQITELDSRWLLSRLEYNQKVHSVETKIKLLVLKHIKHVSAILIYGSAVYNNYKDYNDIDVMILVKKKSWSKLGEKYLMISALKKAAKDAALNLDIKVFASKDVYYSYPSNIALIYELSDCKVIYGVLALKRKVNLTQLDLRMHLDYSYSTLLSIEEDKLDGLKEMRAKELYSAIRNLVVVHLILQKKVSNIALNNTLKMLIGEDIIKNLKKNTNSLEYKELGHIALKMWYKIVRKEVMEMKEDIII